MLQPAEYCYFRSIYCSNCNNTVFSASGKASSAWTVRVDREMVAMELFSELAWQSNIWQDLICISSMLQFLQEDLTVDLTSHPESIALH